MSRKEPKQKRSQELVDSILTAATRVFGSLGFSSASTNEIAEKAGVSVGSLYQYFSDKASIMDKLIDQRLGEIERLIEKKISELQDQDPERVIEILVETAIEMQTQDVSFRRELAIQMLNRGKVGLMIQNRKAVIHSLEGLLRRHLDKLNLRQSDLAIASYVVVNTVQGIRTAVRFDPEMTPELKKRITKETVQMVKLYLLK